MNFETEKCEMVSVMLFNLLCRARGFERPGPREATDHRTHEREINAASVKEMKPFKVRMEQPIERDRFPRLFIEKECNLP